MTKKRTAFKMRSGNSPLFKLMGSSPVKQDYGPEGKPMVDKDEDGIPDFIQDTSVKTDEERVVKLESIPHKEKTGKTKEISPIEPMEGQEEAVLYGGELPEVEIEGKKKRKRGWFGLSDLGITEALDAMTKKQKKEGTGFHRKK